MKKAIRLRPDSCAVRLYGRMREASPAEEGAVQPPNPQTASPRPKPAKALFCRPNARTAAAKPAGMTGFPFRRWPRNPSGLADHYSARVPLPGESEFVKTESVEDTEKYIEYTYVHLALTKAEAVAYFRPLLEKDADFFTLDDNLPHPPLEVRACLPEAASYVALFPLCGGNGGEHQRDQGGCLYGRGRRDGAGGGRAGKLSLEAGITREAGEGETAACPAVRPNLFRP